MLFFIGIVPILFAYVYQFFDFEIVEISDKGYLELNEEEIIIDHQKLIRYEEITDFDVKLIAFYNQKINLAYRMPTERRSLGLSNGIKITTDSQKIILNFKLENSTHQRKLEEVIKQLVINDKLKNIDAKKLIHLIPTRFKKSEDYKDYVIKQIVANRINCTEGLLLHGYNSDKEAKELRKKYCG
ncbi:hypothetical protein ULVI_01775 [Cochleicola gelatinilyticus]|uniref:Uncharacterized protein n=2 Tax=Cochleicola gelatinilyticus TaxID=1763537 RepID=A0A167K657_9FLAO|nr:hypothetical protein ULVI_01775 [Cochleicola gelatinilyticus]